MRQRAFTSSSIRSCLSRYRPLTFIAIPGIVSVYSDFQLINSVILNVDNGHQSVRKALHLDETATKIEVSIIQLRAFLDLEVDIATGSGVLPETHTDSLGGREPAISIQLMEDPQHGGFQR